MQIMRWLGVSLVFGATAVAGCTASTDARDGTIGATRQAVGETVSTDAATYTAGSPVTVSWTNLPGNTYDWITISPQGSPATSYERWTYTMGQVAGSVTFASAPAGTYVARAYEDNAYTILAESAPFTITASAGPASISTDKTAYVTADSAVVSYGGMASHPYDWISIAVPGATAGDYVRWAYTGGNATGTLPFALAGLNGTYVARAHFNNQIAIEAESAPFTVTTSGTTITTDKTSYAFEELVTATFSGMQGSTTDWVSIAPAGSGPMEYSWWEYTQGALSGSMTLSTLPPGTFVARAYLNDSWTIAAESAPFTVAAHGPLPVTVTPTKTSFDGVEPITVTFSGMPGNQNDWIGAFVPLSDMRRHRAWAYTNGATSGTASLWPSYFGTWELRAFFSDGTVLQGRATQTITVNTGIATDKTAYAPADEIAVRYGGMLGMKNDWISIAPQGSGPTSIAVWTYAFGAPGGTMKWKATDLGPGNYVARVYFEDEYTIRAESVPFTVAP